MTEEMEIERSRNVQMNERWVFLRQYIDATMHTLRQLANAVKNCCVSNFQFYFAKFVSPIAELCLSTQDDLVHIIRNKIIFALLGGNKNQLSKRPQQIRMQKNVDH
jgi:hypothetical protein